jgi:P27 family predicted phage terminase small subunit
MSGIPRQPAAIAKLKGLYRPSRHGKQINDLPIEYLSKVPEPPNTLDKNGANFWNDMLNELLKINGLITFVDLPVFEVMAAKWQTIIECNEKLKTDGKWITDTNGNLKENPVYSTLEKAEKTFILLSTHFGCTPSARTKLNFESKHTEPDPFEDFQL